MTTPSEGPSGASQPPTPPSVSPDALGPMPPAYVPADSPFALMFKRFGLEPSAKEMTAIMNNIIRQEISEIKRQQESWKKAMREMRETIEGQ